MMIKTNWYLTERKELDNMFIIIYDFSMAVLMFLFGIYFYKSKGKAARFLSGYNMKSEEERKKYDENAMCKAYGKRMMVMSLPFIVGIIIDIQYQGTGCLIAWMIWLVMFISCLLTDIKENDKFPFIGKSQRTKNRNLWRDFLNFPYFTGFSAN